MARIDTLGNFLTDVATAIKRKTGKTDTITPANFDTEIESIETGSTPNLQSKSIIITENGTTTIEADEGYDGLNSVEVTTNISTVDLSEYFVDIIESGEQWISVISKLPAINFNGTNCYNMFSIIFNYFSYFTSNF